MGGLMPNKNHVHRKHRGACAGKLCWQGVAIEPQGKLGMGTTVLMASMELLLSASVWGSPDAKLMMQNGDI